MNDPEKRNRKNLLRFPIGTAGRDMLYQLFGNFILVYVLFTHQLTPVQLMSITAIIVASRIFDALNDPIMGNIIECIHTGWGKYKPWQLIGILTTSLGTDSGSRDQFTSRTTLCAGLGGIGSTTSISPSAMRAGCIPCSAPSAWLPQRC